MDFLIWWRTDFLSSFKLSYTGSYYKIAYITQVEIDFCIRQIAS